jgi:hypothetical protein
VRGGAGAGGVNTAAEETRARFSTIIDVSEDISFAQTQTRSGLGSGSGSDLDLESGARTGLSTGAGCDKRPMIGSVKRSGDVEMVDLSGAWPPQCMGRLIGENGDELASEDIKRELDESWSVSLDLCTFSLSNLCAYF